MIDIIQEIYGTIKRNKLRTFLTGFAVAWGIFMLIVLLGAGNGLINAFESNAGGRALNSMKVYPGWTNKPFDGLKEGRSIKLTEKDMEITGNFKDNVTAVGATIEQSSVNLSYGEDHVSFAGRRNARISAYRCHLYKDRTFHQRPRYQRKTESNPFA